VAEPGEDARVAAIMSGVANEVVDYLLFIDETKLVGGVRSGSGACSASNSSIAPRAGPP